ncbi:hypothetical protein ACFY20_45435 [Streptomyces sp. NPDC001312]|uniref:hypothetical protein n=1 Tax=Streptomyces sp. NPDC001312 TaxID=3364561 RepID=UPI0036850E0B
MAVTLSGLLGTTRVDLTLFSEATGTTRHYQYADRLNEDMINARVWAGIHSRSADMAGCQTGSRIDVWAVTHYFRPLRPSHARTSPTTRPTCPQTGTR